MDFVQLKLHVIDLPVTGKVASPDATNPQRSLLFFASAKNNESSREARGAKLEEASPEAKPLRMLNLERMPRVENRFNVLMRCLFLTMPLWICRLAGLAVGFATAQSFALRGWGFYCLGFAWIAVALVVWISLRCQRVSRSVLTLLIGGTSLYFLLPRLAKEPYAMQVIDRVQMQFQSANH